MRSIGVDGTFGTALVLDTAGQALGEASLYNDPDPPYAVRAVAALALADSAAHGAASPLARLLAMLAVPNAARLAHQVNWIAAQLGAPTGYSNENNALKTGCDPMRRR